MYIPIQKKKYDPLVSHTKANLAISIFYRPTNQWGALVLNL